ncbi:uncharacterized protein LOC141622709 [Silene latifolia]|uniref:uncharacterized protein LOC141622709 n=1 Tax=Silene latifolia TaxID=37657 RepID=UPI003D76E70C
MEDFGYLWSYQENVDELKQKLHYVTYELEITRKETNQVIMKNNDDIRKLLLMLQNVCKERDEANSQLTNLQQMLAFTNKTQHFHQITPFSPDTPLVTNFPAKTNSSITESTSFSLEPATVSSPDSANICFINTNTATSSKGVDGATMLIENLAKGRPRPRQGKLLQAVIEAGPLLQTLMVAGSLPQWRNPPAQMTRKIPPVQLKGYGKQVVNGSVDRPLYGQSSGGSTPVYPSSMLDFGGGSSGTRVMSSAVSFDCPTPKRQRLL